MFMKMNLVYFNNISQYFQHEKNLMIKKFEVTSGILNIYVENFMNIYENLNTFF